MLILKLSYEQFESDGFFIGGFSLSPSEGQVEYPDATEYDIPKLTHQFLQRAYGENIAEAVYSKNKCSTVFIVDYKFDPLDDKKEKFKFLVTTDNYKAKFGIV